MSTKDTLLKLNRKYCNELQSKPLTTKALTLVFFALLNEQLACFFAGDIHKFKFKLPLSNQEISIPHTLTSKVPLMGLFAFLINAPLTHYGYRYIQKVIPPPLTSRKKFLQILLGTGVITPIFCASFVSWIGLMNHLSDIKNKFQNDKAKSFIKKLQNSLKFISTIILTSLKHSFLKVATTSAATSPIFMLIAQKFIMPEGWAVFFAFCYFILGTYNNTKVKHAHKRQRELREKEMKEMKEKEEKSQEKLD